MKVVYGYKREGETKPILIKNCKFDYDRVKGRLSLTGYDITTKFKEADVYEDDSPYALAIESDERRIFVRFAEAKQTYPMFMGLYVDKDEITMDFADGKQILHCRLTADIADALRTNCPEKWGGWDLAERSVYAEEKR